MVLDRLAAGVTLAAGVVLGCGGGNAAEPPPQTAQAPTPAPNPTPEPSSSATPASSATGEGDPRAICARVMATPAATGPWLGAGDEMKLAKLDSPSKHERELMSPANAKDAYKLADLKALADKGQWEELAAHIEDVPPAKRGAEWEALLERAATDLLGAQSSSYVAFSAAERLVERYPVLTKSERFMAKRFEASKAAFQSCLAETYRGDECLEAMRNFLEVGSPPPTVAFELGKLVRSKLNHQLAVPFFRRGLEGRPENAPECSDRDLGLAVKAGLGLPPDEEYARFAREIAGDRCFPALKPALIAQLRERGTQRSEAQNICSVLQAKGAL
jgi:hypothetical protein